MTTVPVRRHHDDDEAVAALARDVRAGLRRTPKELPPKWLYDARGSELFEQITRLPEYYPTRREREILRRHAGEIAAASDAVTLVELGSGSSEKTRLLLDALAAHGTLARYVPVDVSESALAAAAAALATDYPSLAVEGVVADFERHLDRLPRGPRRLVAFLGGTIGNLAPAARARFLGSVATSLGPGDTYLMGTDLVKDPARLVAAYDDSAGVTAEFDKNVLAVMNRQLDADFDLDAFVHVARWNADDEWIEMRLRSVRDQQVRIGALDMTVTFERGEEMRTEISAKFRREGVEREYAAAGLRLARWWTDPDGDYGLSLAVPA